MTWKSKFSSHLSSVLETVNSSCLHGLDTLDVLAGNVSPCSNKFLVKVLCY